MKVALEARSLSKSYGSGRTEVEALRNVSLSIHERETVALMGPSGCGKSTLLSVLGLILTPTSGSLLINGQEVESGRRNRARLRNQFFGYLHQEFALIDDETVERNAMIPLEYARPRVARGERRTRTHSMVEQLGLKWALRQRVSHLSGGERQRVAVARALVNRPAMVLADEPTGSLDSDTANEVFDVILGIRDQGAAVLIATHDDRVAARCDRTLLMKDGRIVTSS